MNRIGGEGDHLDGEASLASSIEQLVAGSQGIISKRVDLALLEGRELLSRTLQGAMLVGLGIVVTAAAWFAVSASVVLVALPEASPAVRLACFGLLNGGCAVGLVAIALRPDRQRARVRENGDANRLSF